MKLLLALLLFPLSAQAALGLIEVKGSINPGSAAYIQDGIRRAKELKLQGLILQLDTPGGLLSSTRDIVQNFSTAPLPIIIFVAPGGASATSAGAILSLAAHVIAMAPGTNIGAAHPVGGSGEDVKGDMGEKITNDTAALVRAQAGLRGRNEKVAETLVRGSKSFTAEEAVKENLAEFVAKDLDQLLIALNGRQIILQPNQAPLTLNTAGQNASSLVKIPMTLGQRLLHTLANPNISTLLMTLGGIAMYAEISSGFTVIAPGAVAVIAFALAFVSLQLLPINVGGLILFLTGVALLIAEAFVVSYGFLTLGGIASIVVGALFLIDPAGGGSLAISWLILGPVIAALGAIAVTIAWLLAKSGKNTAAVDPIVGQFGQVSAPGKVQIQGEIWNFSSNDNLQVGDRAQVSAKKGLRLTVSKVKE